MKHAPQGQIVSAPWSPVVVVQRKCACGNHTNGGGECEECRKRRQAEAPARGVGGLGGWDLSRIPAHAVAAGERIADGRGEEDPIHRPIIEDFRHREGLPPSGLDERGRRTGPSEYEIKYGGLALPCPAQTEVDQVTDLTPSGLAAGYLSAYGAIVRMRVRPDARTWDGIQITESLTTRSSTCPASLTSGPCSGGSTFTVGGQSGGSGVIPVQPARINRFYDFHTTRSRALSFLHDATRNPAGLNACQTICDQEYSCGGNVIGRHTITRNFRKGTHGGRDVTIIDVTKT